MTWKMKRSRHSIIVILTTLLIANLLLISSCKEDGPGPIEPPLTAEFEASSDTVVLGDAVVFTDLSTNNPTSWKWYFGDGGTSTEQNPTYVYKSLGKHGVTLQVSNESVENSVTKEDYITVLEILTSNPQASDFDLWVDENIMKVFNDKSYSGISIAFIDENNVSKYHYGETKLNSRMLADDNTLYQIASVTKTFVGVAALQWLALNDISLDASVVNYLPEEIGTGLVFDGTEVTFRHLLSHNSGLPGFSFNFDGQCNSMLNTDSSSVYDYIKSHALLRRPGTTPPSNTDLYYSKLGFALLGSILERQNQKPLQEILNEYVLDELGMTATALGNPESFENIAYPYGGYDNTRTCDEIFDYFEGSGYHSAGGLVSNLADMIKYAHFLLSYSESTDLGKALIQSLETQYQWGEETMCLPWWNYQAASGDLIFYHSGGLSGMSTYIAVNNTNKRAAIFMTNNWLSDPDYFLLVDIGKNYVEGTNAGGRIAENMLKTRRRY